MKVDICTESKSRKKVRKRGVGVKREKKGNESREVEKKKKKIE